MSNRPTFNSRLKFVVARQFKFAGRTFKIGSQFSWRTIGCSVRRLRQMYEGRKLNMQDTEATMTEEQLLEQEPALQQVDKVIAPVVAPEVIDKPAADEVEASTEVAPEVKPELSDEEKKEKKAARRKAARKAAKLAKNEE